MSTRRSDVPDRDRRAIAAFGRLPRLTPAADSLVLEPWSAASWTRQPRPVGIKAEVFIASDVSQYTIQRPRHAREIQRVDEQPRVPDLPAAVSADEAPELLGAAPCSPRRLLLERAERSKLALRLDDLFHTGRTKAAEQLVLQVSDAHVEPEGFHLGATEVGTEAGSLQTAPEVALLTGVTQARQPEVQPRGPNRSRKCRMFLAPPIGTTAMPSAARSRPRRSASASSATWSLIPSTSTTARGSTLGPSAGAAVATSGASCRQPATRRLPAGIAASRSPAEPRGPAMIVIFMVPWLAVGSGRCGRGPGVGVATATSATDGRGHTILPTTNMTLAMEPINCVHAAVSTAGPLRP
jgi:hypothetical protein